MLGGSHLIEIRIEQEELLEMTSQFKLWSGPILTKIFNKTGVPGYSIGSLGSGGFLHYKDKFFVVTARHVLDLIPFEGRLTNVIVPYEYAPETKAITFIKHAEDKESDIAALEIKPETAGFMTKTGSKYFLEQALIDDDPLGYFRKISNVVFLHGFAGENTDFDYENMVIDMTTTPYTTFIDRVDEASGRIVLLANKEGTSEFGIEGTKLPVFKGMSGSFAYSYRREDHEHPYRCLGILANGDKEAGIMWVIPISEVIEFLDREFF